MKIIYICIDVKCIVILAYIHDLYFICVYIYCSCVDVCYSSKV